MFRECLRATTDMLRGCRKMSRHITETFPEKPLWANCTYQERPIGTLTEHPIGTVKGRPIGTLTERPIGTLTLPGCSENILRITYLTDGGGWGGAKERSKYHQIFEYIY